MTTTDKNNIKILYYFYRYSQLSISKLYGLSHTRIQKILKEEQNVTAIPVDDCFLCDIDGAKQYFIDGNENNNKPQNKIMLCEGCKRRIEHLQIRRHEGMVRSQY